MSSALDRARPAWRTIGFEGWVVALIGALTVARLIVAAVTPLAFDEALYWSYSKHLAAGYLDHPFLNPLLIRLGCALFGDTPLGVRFFDLALSLPASWAVWKAGEALFDDGRLGAIAALLFNLTVVMSVGAMAATSDQVVVATTCLLLWSMAKLQQTGRPGWWLAVGAAFGLGMCAKYTTLFFAPGILAWVVMTNRAWLRTVWPWLAGLVALAVFSPVLLWNAEHGWASVLYQSGRLSAHHYGLNYVGELIGATIGLATPPIFVLAVLGLWRGDVQTRAARILLAGFILPFLAYFFVHALHERVQGNWIEPVYPAAAILAAYGAVSLAGRQGRVAAWARWSFQLALPFGLLLAALAYLSVTTGVFPIARHDPRTRILALGWPALGPQIEALRQQAGAPVILTTDYTLTGWTRFYLPSTAPVVQINQRMRWANEPAPPAELLRGPALYICRDACPQLGEIRARYRSVTQVATLTRTAGGRAVSFYPVYRLGDPFAPVLDSPTLIPRAGAR